MAKDIIVYICPGGSHYHATKDCPMLQGGDYERLCYYPIKLSDLKYMKRTYRQCSCVVRGREE